MPSKSTNIANEYLCSARMTESLSRSPSGRTLPHSTGDPGLDAWISSLADSPARTSAWPDGARGSRGQNRDSGERWPGLLARFDSATSSWKTLQHSLFEDSEQSLAIFPRCGSMRNGELFPRRKSVRRICVNDSGLWRTLIADDARERKAGAWNSRGEPKLSAQVKLLPTLQARDNHQPHKLEYIAAKKAQGHGMANLNDCVGGILSPEWCEIFMGFPLGWTSREPLSETEFYKWLMGFCDARDVSSRYGREAWENGSWEASIPRVAKKGPNRRARVYALGNAQVPAVVKAAWNLLNDAPGT